MDANEYQKLAVRTLIDRPDFAITDDQVMLAWSAIGLAGEAGEVAELAKKQIFHQHGLDREEWKKELGDVLWYVAACCTRLGLTLDEVMDHNVRKLMARFPDGYDPARTTGDHKVGLAD
jgi:NTP pyrophosphatase (non-canonical NTP hydrolase)